MAIYPEWVATEAGGTTDPAMDTGADGAGETAEQATADRTAPAGAETTLATDSSDGTAAGAVAASAATADQVGSAPPPVAAIPVDGAPVPAPAGWSDPLTGTDGPHYWDRLIISEGARVRRYKHASTVVLVEIAGLTRLGNLWGADVAERTLISAARTLSQSIRTSDHIARIEPIRFGILLTETAEIEAINFIERARASCERDLRVASEAVGVAFGWASPPKSGDLADAVALATKRLTAELNSL
jgi:diguanylate cyclase (GGDEF)-like protein